MGGGAALAKNPMAKQAGEEMEFGYKAAKRGYWQEALERFELADELTPNQARILNNIAVALEANGRFDEARTTYQAALALDPSSSALKKNIARFEEFYAAYVVEPEEDDDSVSGPDDGSAADSGTDPGTDTDTAKDAGEADHGA
jgi:tetratricopeptide (TPR) repeat protein